LESRYAGPSLQIINGRLRRGMSIYTYGKLGLEILKRGLKPKISRLNIGVTTRCNQKCLTCNIWQQYPERYVSLEDYFQILTSNKLMWVTLTGGEPSTHPNFEDMLRVSAEFVDLVQLNTNGVLGSRIEKAVLSALKVKMDSLVIVSVSIFGEKHHHEMITRLPGSFDHAVATIKRLKKLNNNRLKIGIANTICEYNANQYPYIESLAESLGVGVSYAIERHSSYYRNETDVNGYKPILPAAKFSFNPLNLFKDIYLLHGDRRSGCVAGEYSCWVMPDMTVYPCISAIPDKPSFNLKDSGFKLKGFENSRDYVKNCKGCWTACETYQTILFRPWRILK
jgi:MoaA/NifB/PqqE/SkfB family radical SAM enzyme